MNEYQVSCEVCGDPFTPNGRRKKRCPKTHMKACANESCENMFELMANHKPDKSFCSYKCSGDSRKKMRTCVICGNSFHKASKTCSQECEFTLRNKTYAETADDRECEYCHQLFKPANASQKYCDNVHYRPCLLCGSEFSFEDPLSRRKYCSSECASVMINSDEANSKRDATNLENYGTTVPQRTEKWKQQQRDANIEKYGVIHALQLDEFKDKVKANNQEKYGVEWTLQVPEIRSAIAKTNMERYGSENPWGSPIIQDKVKRTILERYGVENVMMVPEHVIKSQETFSESVNNGTVSHPKVSKLNRNFAMLLKKECEVIDDIRFEQSFGRFQADLGLNDSKLLIDLHPTVSHNAAKSFGCVIGGCDEGCTKHKIVEQNYHYKRALAARDIGVSLLQCFDWDSEHYIINKVNAKLGKKTNVIKVSARKLQLKRVPQSVANAFLQNVHVQGKAKGQSHCYALMDDHDEIISVATFGQSRFNSRYDYEFIRYAVKEGYVIHGGSGRLFKAFIDDVSPESVISYVDFNHTTGDTFLPSLGFSEDTPTGPALVYFNIKDKRKYSNTSVLAVGADKLLGTQYGSRAKSGVGNAEIMVIEGFLPVYTAGNRVFTWSA